MRTSTTEIGQLAAGCTVVTFPVDLEKLRRYLATKREETGMEITFTHIAIKCCALAIADFQHLNGHVILGGFFRSRSSGVDVSVTVDTSDVDTATLKVEDANFKPVDYIADELLKRAEALKAAPPVEYTRKARILALFPNFLRYIIEYILNFMGSQLGISIPALGVKEFPLGVCTILTSRGKDMGDADFDVAMVPTMSVSSTPITVAIGGVKITPSMSNSGVLSGTPTLIVTVTVDSQAGSLVETRKFCGALKSYMNNPNSLDKADRLLAIAAEDKRVAEEKAQKKVR